MNEPEDLDEERTVNPDTSSAGWSVDVAAAGCMSVVCERGRGSCLCLGAIK